MVKIGINGFGRIGRLILRALLENYKEKIEVIAINDLGSIEANAHLVKYASTHGTMPFEIETSDEGFKILNQSIKVFAERDPKVDGQVRHGHQHRRSDLFHHRRGVRRP